VLDFTNGAAGNFIALDAGAGDNLYAGTLTYTPPAAANNNASSGGGGGAPSTLALTLLALALACRARRK
jgi:MYXO-CTERM domain-containing protein